MIASDDILEDYKDLILKHTTDGEEGYKEYLATDHINIITGNIICLYSLMDGYISLYYLQVFNKKGRVEALRFCMELFKEYTTKQQMPIVYTGIDNLFKNNSVELEKGLYQFMPKNM